MVGVLTDGHSPSNNWAMNKCRRMLFGQCFVWTTDCYAIKFILSYDGANPAILRLQMCLMCWDVDIVHQNDYYIADADYWLQLGADLCFDLLFKKIPGANPVTSYREPTTNFPPNAT